MLHSSIEFWGANPDLIKKADSFVYSAMKVLFDLPVATPHRAISSEFHMIPSGIRYNLLIRRIASRQLRYRPLRFMDSYFPPGDLSQRIMDSIDPEYLNLPPVLSPYLIKWPANV